MRLLAEHQCFGVGAGGSGPPICDVGDGSGVFTGGGKPGGVGLAGAARTLITTDIARPESVDSRTV